MTCAYFVSDLHLKSMDEPKALVFVRFLEKLHSEINSGQREKPTHLFLVGDIFDLWIGAHEFFIERFGPVVHAIKQLVEDGISVHFFEGNHDLYLRHFWQDQLGVQVHEDAEFFTIAGKTVRVEHGDLINSDDHGYLFLRKLLRTPALRFLAKNLSSGLVNAIGERASKASRGYTAKRVDEERIRKMIRHHSETAFMEKSYDLIITGHVHVLDDHVFNASGKTVRSVNLGSWFDSPRAFVLSDSRAELIGL